MDGQAQPLIRDEAIRFNLSVPVTRIGVGPFSFDPVEQLLGASLADILEPLRVGPVERRPSASGTAVEVHPLALPEGEGLVLPLGQFGEVGFKNDHGLLRLSAPAVWGGALVSRLGEFLASGPRRTRSVDGSADVVTCWATTRPGIGFAVDLGPIGELAIDVPGGPCGRRT